LEYDEGLKTRLWCDRSNWAVLKPDGTKIISQSLCIVSQSSSKYAPIKVTYPKGEHIELGYNLDFFRYSIHGSRIEIRYFDPTVHLFTTIKMISESLVSDDPESSTIVFRKSRCMRKLEVEFFTRMH
jgi:hypothetical protein